MDFFFYLTKHFTFLETADIGEIFQVQKRRSTVLGGSSIVKFLGRAQFFYLPKSKETTSERAVF